MDETLLLTNLALFTLLAGLCSTVLNKVKFPPLIGYLVAGIVIANVTTVDETGEIAVELLSDIGLILLMFCLGLEINLKKLKKQGTVAIKVAITQLPLSVIGGMLAGTLMGFGSVQSLILGAVLAGCSTAVVTAVLYAQKNLDRESIETIILIMIMEDIGQVIMLSILTPIMAGSSMDTSDLIVLITTIAIFMAGSLFLGLKFAHRIINWISDNVSEEILLIISVGMAFLMALIANLSGLSMAIGAFLMGMIMTKARKKNYIEQSVMPMKNLFMAMFFISVGMEVNLGTLVSNVGMMFIIYLLFAGLLIFTVSLGFWIAGVDGRKGFVSAVGLTAMGEFAFIISKEALDYGAVNESFYTSVIGAALISMIIMPIANRYSDRVWTFWESKRPQFISNWSADATGFRDKLYSNFSSASRRSKKIYRRGMASGYIDLLAIIVIELAFYIGAPILSRTLYDIFGGSVWLWNFVLLIINFIVLIPPISYLVSNIKNLEKIVIGASRNMAKKGGGGDLVKTGDLYEKILGMSNLIIVLAIDVAIIAIIPNPLGLIEHIMLLAIAIGVAIAIYLRMTSKKPKHTDDGDDAEKNSHVEETDVGIRDTGERRA